MTIKIVIVYYKSTNNIKRYVFDSYTYFKFVMSFQDTVTTYITYIT